MLRGYNYGTRLVRETMKVLIVIDSSSASERLLQPAMARPWRTDTKFCVLNAIDVQRLGSIHPLTERNACEHLVNSSAQNLYGAECQTFTSVLQSHPRSEIRRKYHGR
jgi:hypothetical protein